MHVWLLTLKQMAVYPLVSYVLTALTHNNEWGTGDNTRLTPVEQSSASSSLDAVQCCFVTH